MKKLFVTLLLFLFPFLVLADGALSFAPPPSDYSVVFLGNLFGVVDGVLSGSGSQIMGSMFAVFNSAVLALGGIIIMYTLMVSTMNTAHEGQMLGQKWSSIWIPVRSTLGLALLIPKASGYCMMQIFVMWVVVQGVGAADKVWEAALGYLNRGGVIIQAQINPTTAMTNPTSSGVAKGASAILTGQVCMLGLQKQLEALKKNLNSLNLCANSNGTALAESSPYYDICTSSIPDFIGSVNVVSVQDKAAKSADKYEATMPNFTTEPWNYLNGICGSIKWNPIKLGGQNLNSIAGSTGSNSSVGGISVSSSQLQSVQMSRAIAIQQMYMDLSAVAQVMVNNDPLLSTSAAKESDYTLNARQQFGVPYTQTGTLCSKYSETCVSWGPSSNGGVLFSGTELQGAMTDYHGIMAPTLKLISDAGDATNAKNQRAFIAKATTDGWIMAGSYFFDLVFLNGNAVSNAQNTDSNTGLDGSTGGLNLTLGEASCVTATDAKYTALCNAFNLDLTLLRNIQFLIDGSYSKAGDTSKQPPPKVEGSDIAGNSAASGWLSSSVYGFINNSVMVQLPGQPGVANLQFANMIHFNIDPNNYKLPDAGFDCGGISLGFFKVCIGRMMGNLFYNVIFRFLYNFFFTAFTAIINQVVMTFLMIPLSGMAAIFKQGMQTISQPGINPVIALATMGVFYINFAANLWLMLLNMAIMAVLIGPFGIFIFALLALALPLLLAWVGVMVSVGFITAYYVPVLPYMIFTFGSLAWLISVIEAMVAAPIVALGVTHPEGHDAFGKGEAAIMLLMNIFLRPALMIIGYISGIALCYVGVWILNAGFDHAISFIQSGNIESGSVKYEDILSGDIGRRDPNAGAYFKGGSLTGGTDSMGQESASGTGGYSDWAGIYAYFFSILIYTSTYLVIVQQAFTLISLLPDKVLRWIGGTPESIGQESAKWGEEAKGKISEAGKGTQDAQGQLSGKLGGYGQKAAGAMAKGGGKASFTGTSSTAGE